MRRVIRILKNMLMPWRKATNALWFQIRNHQKRINGISYRLNELELSLESVSGKLAESSKPRRGRPRKKSS